MSDIGQLREECHADACLRCHKCTAGCPVASQMDLPPSRTVRLIQLGGLAELFETGSMWLCTSCHTCTTRCPAGVDLARAQAWLRTYGPADRGPVAARRVAAFDDAVLATVQRHGRMHELEAMGRFKLHTRVSLEDLRLGTTLMRNGKLPLRARRVRERAEIGAAVRAARRRHRRGG